MKILKSKLLVIYKLSEEKLYATCPNGEVDNVKTFIISKQSVDLLKTIGKSLPEGFNEANPIITDLILKNYKNNHSSINTFTRELEYYNELKELLKENEKTIEVHQTRRR